MVFELRFECPVSYQEELAFFIQNALKEDLSYLFNYEENALKLWIDYHHLTSQALEEIVQKLSRSIPKSLFIAEVTSQLIEKHDPIYKEVIKPQSFIQFCPQCLDTQVGHRCFICHSLIAPIDHEMIQKITQKLLDKKIVELESKSGKYCLSTQVQESGGIVYCLDIQSVLELCNLTQKELYALASFEKPIVRVRTNKDNLYGIKQQEIRLALAQDLPLFRVFEDLSQRGIKFLFSTEGVGEKFCLQKSEASLPKYEVVVLENDDIVLLNTPNISEKLKEKFASINARDKAFLSTIIMEHHLENQNILNLYFSTWDTDCICLYNGQTQWFNAVMKIELPKNTDELFGLIKKEAGGESLLQNYSKAYPHLMQSQDFTDLPQSFCGIWKIVERVLGFSAELLEIARDNLHQRGVGIDYKIEPDQLIAQNFDLVSCVRSGMSFKLAGVEEGIIALGYIESFSLLPSKLYLEIRKLVDIDGISFCGDLFANKMIGDFFYKNNRQTFIYRNQAFPLLYQK